jgi:uroporphyrinogen decarboxylase
MFYTLFSPLFYLMFRSVCGTLKNRFLNPVVDRLGKFESINEKVLKGVRLGKFKKLGESGVLETDPEAFSIAHDALTQDLKALAKRLLTEGRADGIFLSVQESPGISPEQYKKLISPGEKEILNVASGISNYNILHVCGQNFSSNLSNYADYNAKAFNWPAFEHGPSLREGKALLGGKAVIGGFAEGKNGVLFKGTKEEIESFTEKLVSDTGRKGLIIGADCSVPDSVSWERLKWARDKAAAL